MINRPRAAATAVAVLALVSLVFASPATAGPDRTAPTTPGNFRVTGVTPYFAQLAWDPSTDNSGSVRYQITVSNGESTTLPNGTTTHSWFLAAGYRYTFTIRAIDPSGNRSRFRVDVGDAPVGPDRAERAGPARDGHGRDAGLAELDRLGRRWPVRRQVHALRRRRADGTSAPSPPTRSTDCHPDDPHLQGRGARLLRRTSRRRATP